MTDGAAPAGQALARQAPLSSAQERLWVLDRLQPGAATYIARRAWRVEGLLDVVALQRSLNVMASRHEILRTTFPLVEHRPVQLIAPALDVPLRTFDVTHLPADERESQASQLVREESTRAFDLARGPLFRAALVRLENDRHVFVLMLHHIVWDGGSTAVFNREFGASYDAYRAGRNPAFDDLPIQYADFAVWQQQLLEDGMLAEALGHWREHLAGAPASVDLPTDRPRPAIQSSAGAARSRVLPPDVSAGVFALSRAKGATAFMTLFAAFNALLYRYTAQDDLVVGTLIANRTRSELEGLIGFFVNTLALRTKITGESRFSDVLERIREATIAAYEHQDLPFERLVAELQPQRSLSNTPLINTIFFMEGRDELGDALQFAGLRLSKYPLESTAAKFDINLRVTERADGLACSLQFATDLFDATTMDRFLEHFEVMLRGIVRAPETPVAALPLLAPAERQYVVSELNDTQTPFPAAARIHELFEAQVDRAPEATAVVFAGRSFSYEDIDSRANLVAERLRTLGIEPEAPVGVCLDRSADMPIALLGVLKAGAAYVPLDPTFPPERLRFMLEDSGVAVVLGNAAFRQLFSGLPNIVYADLETAVAERSIDVPAENQLRRESADSKAYIMYTSGSTGRPKGVPVPHRAVVNFLHSMAREPGLTAADTMLAVTTLSFDIAGLELWLPLCFGARVEIAPRAALLDGPALASLLETSGATIMQATPSTWELLLADGWSGRPGLKMLCGGEALPARLAEQLLSRGQSLWNMYGPTETTIWSAVKRVRKGEPIAIGRPIANTQLYVLDDACQPLPIGVPGELSIGGAGLALGYLNRPELSAERFIPDPFSEAEDARLYKTGDRARVLSSGDFEVLGRLDRQVKLRGYRIELGEVEATLREHPALAEAVVSVAGERAHERRLVAYVVNRGQRVSVSELREFVLRRLPEYMVPSSFTEIRAVPLNANGKVDYRALPLPDAHRPNLGQRFVLPRTPGEEALAAVWKRLLRLESVGVHDNFFELGGHSLLATQLVSQLREALEVELPLRALFESPTVATLAARMETASVGSVQSRPIAKIRRDWRPARV